MARVPNADQLLIPAEKVVYLLDAAHLENRGKADWFASYGFRLDRPNILAAALAAVASAEATVNSTPHGVKYVCEGTLETPDGRNPWVRVIVQIDHGATTPKFVTAYPHRRRR